MTGPGGGKIEAHAYSTASAAGTAQSPLDWGNKCFLCGNTINIDTPPVDPREFYVSPKTGKMLLCHSKCINIMNQRGGTPADFHAGNPATTLVTSQQVPTPPVKEQGAAWLAFETLADLTAYTTSKGEISSEVKVTVGGSVIQAGE